MLTLDSTNTAFQKGTISMRDNETLLKENSSCAKSHRLNSSPFRTLKKISSFLLYPHLYCWPPAIPRVAPVNGGR